MSEPFLGEIRMFGFSFAPKNWAFCNGQSLPVKSNVALYSLLGTTFGGDGVNDFMLPDLQGRTPVHVDSRQFYANSSGIKGGAETVSLDATQLAPHRHNFYASSEAADRGKMHADDRVLASVTLGSDGSPYALYGEPVNLKELNVNACADSGGQSSHNNLQPFQVVNFCIALTGIYPSRN